MLAFQGVKALLLGNAHDVLITRRIGEFPTVKKNLMIEGFHHYCKFTNILSKRASREI
jgi:hypothetical protein